MGCRDRRHPRARRARRARAERPRTGAGAEADRVDAVEWLAAQQRGVEAEDAHRTVTELDLPIRDEEFAGLSRPVLDDETELRKPSPAHDVAPLDPDDVELAALLHTATKA